MKAISSVLIPFAKDIKTKQYVGIDEVPNGLACNCVCISCGMTLEARQGDEREHHFKHKNKAKKECKISYWVSIRSIAEQILEQAKFIYIPPISKTTSIQVQSVDKGYSKEHQFTFDLKLNTSIGTIFVYFITGEGIVEGRSQFYLDQLPQYFTSSLILEIDIKSIRKNHSQAKAHLYELLIHKTLNKHFVATQQVYSYKNLSKTTSLKTVTTSFKQPTIKLIDYSDFIRDILGYKDLSIFDSEDLQVCSQMLSFYHDRSGNLKWRNLQKYHVGIQAQVLCVARIRTDYFIYNVNEIGKINIIKKVGSQFIVDQFIKGRNVPDIKQPSRKVSSLNESKILRAWAVMKKERRTYIEKYTIVSQSWNIKIACCKSNYFGFLKHNEEWLVFEVVNNEVKVITHISKEEGIQSYIEALAEKANDVF